MTTNSKLTLKIIGFAALGGLFAMLQIHHSLRHGQLALPITYDDNAYFGDALTRLAAFHDNGLWHGLKGLVDNPPHSPWSTAVPFFAFALFGNHDFSPAIANGIMLAAFLGLYGLLTKNLPFRFVFPVIIAALTWPIAGHFVIESRPDIAWGLMVAISAALICSAGTDGSKSLQFGAGALTGFALLAKPPIIPVTFFTVLAALAFSSFFRTSIEIGHRSRSGMFLASCARVFGIAAVVGLPYYLIGGHHVIEYIRAHVLGAYKEIWNVKMAWHQHLAYYLLGPGGSTMMGGWIHGWIVTAGTASAIALVKRERAACRFMWAYSATFLATYLAVSLAKTKSPYLGAVIPAMALVSWIVAALYLFIVISREHDSRFRLWVLGIAMLAFGLLIFDWPWDRKGGIKIANELHEGTHKMVERVVAGVSAEEGQETSVFVAGAGAYLNAATLNYYALKQGRSGVVFRDLHLSADLKAYKRSIGKSDFVVVFDPDSGIVFTWLPSGDAAFQKKVREFVRNEPGFSLVDHVLPSPSEGGVVIYENQRHVRHHY